MTMLLLYFYFMLACQEKMDKVTSASEENIQPFKNKMESFISSG